MLQKLGLGAGVSAVARIGLVVQVLMLMTADVSPVMSTALSSVPVCARSAVIPCVPNSPCSRKRLPLTDQRRTRFRTASCWGCGLALLREFSTMTGERDWPTVRP